MKTIIDEGILQKLTDKVVALVEEKEKKQKETPPHPEEIETRKAMIDHACMKALLESDISISDWSLFSKAIHENILTKNKSASGEKTSLQNSEHAEKVKSGIDFSTPIGDRDETEPDKEKEEYLKGLQKPR